MKTFLVTGCAGFIPSNLIDEILACGFRVIGIDDLSIGKEKTMQSFIDNNFFTFIKGDVRDKKLLSEIIPKVNYIYHGAVRGVNISAADPVADIRTNTESTLLILEEMRKNKVDLFIYPSSASVYGSPKKLPENENDNPLPLSQYGVSKLAAERYCLVYHHIYHLPVVCLRYFNNYGKRQRKDSTYGGVISIFFEQALSGKDLTIYGKGNQTRDYIFVGDTIKATLSCLNNPKAIGEVINIATGVETSVNDLAKTIIKITKTKSKIVYLKDRIIDNVKKRAGDNKKAKRLLSISPKTTLKVGLEKTYLWMKENL